MKKSVQYAIILLVGLIALNLGALFLNPLNNNSNNISTDNSTKIFSKDNITFNYPANWQDYTEKFNTNNIEKQLAFVGDPTTVGFEGMALPTTTFIITKNEYTSNNRDFSHPEGLMPQMLIEGYVNNTKKLEDYQNYQNISVKTRNFTISGLKAHEFIFIGFHTSANNWEYTRMIALEKRDISNKKETFYVIMCTAMDSEIGKSKMIFDRIIDSFKVH